MCPVRTVPMQAQVSSQPSFCHLALPDSLPSRSAYFSKSSSPSKLGPTTSSFPLVRLAATGA